MSIISDSSSYSSDSDDDLFTSAGTLNSVELKPKDNDYSEYLDKLDRDLRIGGSFHIGTTAHQFMPSYDRRPSIICKTKCEPGETACTFLRHPFNLLLARERGDIGSGGKARRLRYRATRWRTQGHQRFDGLQSYGNRLIGTFNPDPHTFQETIQGSQWAVSRLHLKQKFQVHRGCVNTVCFNAEGNWIASGSDDLRVVITDWASNQQVARYHSSHHANIFHVKFIPKTQDRMLVSCACDSDVRLAQLGEDGSLVGSTRVLASHDGSAHKLALPLGEPNIVMSAGADGKVFSIDLRTESPTVLLEIPECELFSIASNPANPYEFVISGRSEAVIRTYDRRKVHKNKPHRGFLHAYGPKHLSLGSGRAVRFQAEDSATDSIAELGRALRIESRAHQNGATANANDDRNLREDQGSDRSESDSEDDASEMIGSITEQLGRRVRALLNGVRRRNRRRGEPLNADGSAEVISYKMEPSNYSVTTAMYSAQGDALLASYNDEDIYLFDVKRPGAPYLHRYSGHRNMQTIVSANFFGPNSEYVVSGSDDGFFYIWDRESEGIVQWKHADVHGAVNVIESHPCLPVLASAGLDHDFKLWAPLRPCYADLDNRSLPHLKYTDRKVSSRVLRLRRSDLARAVQRRKHPKDFSTAPSEKGTDSNSNSSDGYIDVGMDWATSDNIDSTSRAINRLEEAQTMGDSDVGMSMQSSSHQRKRRHSSSAEPVIVNDCNGPQCNSESLVTTCPTASMRTGHIDSGSQSEQDYIIPPASDVLSLDDSLSGPDEQPKHRRRMISPVECNNPLSKGDRLASHNCHASMDNMDSAIDGTSSHDRSKASQALLPFDRDDLELRVAQNWINRASERAQLEDLGATRSRFLAAIQSLTSRRSSRSLIRVLSNRIDDSDLPLQSSPVPASAPHFFILSLANDPDVREVPRGHEYAETVSTVSDTSTSSTSSTSTSSTSSSNSTSSTTTMDTSSVNASTVSTPSSPSSSAASDDSDVLGLFDLNSPDSSFDF